MNIEWKKYYFNGEKTDYSISSDGQVRKDTINRILSQSS